MNDVLLKKIEELKEILNSNNPNKEEEFRQKSEGIRDLCQSEEDGNAVADFMLERYALIEKELAEIKEALTVREQLQPIADAISLSYIAKHYFGKSKQWLSNKMGGYIIHGKPATFTEEEKQTLNAALADLSKRIGSINIS
jgi:hypothetical protein